MEIIKMLHCDSPCTKNTIGISYLTSFLGAILTVLHPTPTCWQLFAILQRNQSIKQSINESINQSVSQTFTLEEAAQFKLACWCRYRCHIYLALGHKIRNTPAPITRQKAFDGSAQTCTIHGLSTQFFLLAALKYEIIT